MGKKEEKEKKGGKKKPDMKRRIYTIQPKHLTAKSMRRGQQKVTFAYSINAAYHGSEVALLVYDRELYEARTDRTAFNNDKREPIKRHRLEKSDWTKPLLLANDPKKTTGLLFRATGILHFMGPSENGNIFALKHGSQKVSPIPNPVVGLKLQMHVLSRDGKARKLKPIGTIAYPAGDVAELKGNKKRRELIFRFVLIKPGKAEAGTPRLPGTLLFSSFNTEQHASGAHFMVDHVAFGVLATRIGRPKSQKPPPEYLVRARKRDLTGAYEAKYSPGNQSPFYLHLNQAGGVLVGWFRPGVTPPPLQTGTVDLNVPDKRGCLFVDLEKGPSANMAWGLARVVSTKVIKGTHGAESQTYPIFSDPHNTELPNPGGFQVVLDASGGPEDLRQTIRLSFVTHDPQTNAFKVGQVEMERVSNDSRIPFEVFRQLPATHFKSALFERLDSPSSAELNHIWRIATRGFQQAIDHWFQGGSLDRMKAKDSASEVLSDLFSPYKIKLAAGGAQGAYAAARYDHAVSTFKAYASHKDHKVRPKGGKKSDEKTTLSWLKEMVAHSLDQEGKTADPNDAKLGTALRTGFFLARLVSSNKFRYDLEFLHKGFAVPRIGMGLEGGVFRLQVKKLRAKPQTLGKPGTKVEFEEHPEDKKRWKDQIWWGVYADIGIGITTKIGGAGAMGDAKITTSADLEPTDLNDATFHITSFKLLSGSFLYGGKKAAVLDSGLFELKLTSGLSISAVTTILLESKPWKTPKPKDVIKSKGNPTKVSVFSLAMAHGHLASSPPKAPPKVKEPDPKKPAKAKIKHAEVVAFDFASTAIRQKQLAILEANFAVWRAFYELPLCSVEFHGHTCRVDSEGSNRILSKGRAESARNALKGALTSRLRARVDHKQAIHAHGEERAEKAGEPDYPKALAKLPKEKQKELENLRDTSWPKYRIVEVYTHGQLTLKMRADRFS